MEVDPYHVLTPEFRDKLVQDAAFRRARNQAMGLPADPGPTTAANHPAMYADALDHRDHAQNGPQ